MTQTESRTVLETTCPTYEELLDALDGLLFSMSPRKTVPVFEAAGYSTDMWKAAHRHARTVLRKAGSARGNP